MTASRSRCEIRVDKTQLPHPTVPTALWIKDSREQLCIYSDMAEFRATNGGAGHVSSVNTSLVLCPPVCVWAEECRLWRNVYLHK